MTLNSRGRQGVAFFGGGSPRIVCPTRTSAYAGPLGALRLLLEDPQPREHPSLPQTDDERGEQQEAQDGSHRVLPGFGLEARHDPLRVELGRHFGDFVGCGVSHEGLD